jgi:hypothetical protein
VLNKALAKHNRMLIDRILELSQALWLLAFALYALDVVRLVPTGRLLLRETSGARFVPVLAAYPFEIAHKELYVAGILSPWRAAFMARWSGRVDAQAQNVARVDALLQQLTGLRLASVINFLLLFVVAPVVTSLIGLGGAILVVAPPVYLFNLCAGVYVLGRRARFNLKPAAAGWLLADALLCAPYGANWVKRIARLQPELTEDVTQLQARIDAAAFERLSSVIGLRQTLGSTER